jgi:organic hydroperoxide reductase OsmC/OhrA
VHATLRVPPVTDHERATRLLEKAEHVCLISNSLVSQRRLETNVIAG